MISHEIPPNVIHSPNPSLLVILLGLMFLSTFHNRIDKKARVSVPSIFRGALAGDGFQGVVLFRSYRHQALEGCGMARMQQLSQRLDQLAAFSDEQEQLATSIFADAEALSFDGDGRIVLSERLRSHAGLEEEAVFVGQGATFQIWNPAAFEAHVAKARQLAKSQKMSLAGLNAGGMATPPGGAS